MLSRVIAKNVGDVFFETQCTSLLLTKTNQQYMNHLQQCKSKLLDFLILKYFSLLSFCHYLIIYFSLLTLIN